MILAPLGSSIAAYEADLGKALGSALVQSDLDRKHALMAEDAFLFLRATCWRWAEAAPDLCPELMPGPLAGSVGDAHAGNFGLWRDAAGRLVWGVNDYDEAARLPYGLDLARLCASILLADADLSAADVAESALEGYRRGLEAPAPIVLERRRLWLRTMFEATNDHRLAYWDRLEALARVPAAPPPYGEVLRAGLPADVTEVCIAPRTAGVGSLGRPRFVALGLWRGGPIASEVKALTPSCWTAGREPGLRYRLAFGRYRAADPSLLLGDDHLLRRLSPNNRKLAFTEIAGRLRGRLIRAMAADIAAIHAAASDLAAIRADVEARPKRWLADAARTVAAWTEREWKEYRHLRGVGKG